jgi:hypothetical protein
MEAVPVIDIREGGPPAHAERRREQALALRAACLGHCRHGGPAGRLAAEWHLRLRLHGAEGREGPMLRRTLDWPFPGLGRLVEIVRQPQCRVAGLRRRPDRRWAGRFAASISQAPMRRRTKVGWLLWLDYALNAVLAFCASGRPPPEHVLRAAFETCTSFDEACRFLETTPVARPVLYLLTGCAPGERLLIEHDGERVRRYADRTVVANARREQSDDWRPRVCGEGTPVENNGRRMAAMAAYTDVHPPNLEWAVLPVVNAFTRLAVELCAASGRLVVAGWEAEGRVTAVTEALSPRA